MQEETEGGARQPGASNFSPAERAHIGAEAKQSALNRMRH